MKFVLICLAFFSCFAVGSISSFFLRSLSEIDIQWGFLAGAIGGTLTLFFKE